MRKRSLSDNGVQLYLAAIQPPRQWYRRLICNLFHSDYDDRMFSVLCKSRKSTQALCAEFLNPTLSRKLDAGIHNTIHLILNQQRDFSFFLDVMWAAFQKKDHQTAHMLYIALTDKALDGIRIPKRGPLWFEAIANEYGSPIYEKHIHYWRNVRTDNVLPSVIAFHNFVRRRQFMMRDFEAQEAIDFMVIFQYLEHDPNDVLPVYQNKK